MFFIDFDQRLGAQLLNPGRNTQHTSPKVFNESIPLMSIEEGQGGANGERSPFQKIESQGEGTWDGAVRKRLEVCL